MGANKILKGWRTSLSSTTVVSFPYSVRSDVQFYSYTIDKYEYAYLPLTGTYSLTKCVGTVDITTIPTTYDDGTHGAKNVTEIGTEAFKGTAITSMIIPSTITKISERTFAECASLGTLYIPTSVTSILEGAIYGDSSLSIYCQVASKPSTWNDYWNVVHYFSEATYHSSADTFNKNIVWGYTH